MATYDRGIFGKSSGKVGNIVLYPDRNKQRMRTMAPSHTDAMTTGQLAHRQKIKNLSWLYNDLPRNQYDLTFGTYPKDPSAFINLIKLLVPQMDANLFDKDNFKFVPGTFDWGLHHLWDHQDGVIAIEFKNKSQHPGSYNVEDEDNFYHFVYSPSAKVFRAPNNPTNRATGGQLDIMLFVWGPGYLEDYWVFGFFHRPSTGEISETVITSYNDYPTVWLNR